MTSLTFPRNAFQRTISKGTSSLRTFLPLGCISKSERSYNAIHFQRQFPPDVPAPGTKALYQMWSLGAEVGRRAWRAQLQVTRSSAQFGEWMSSLGKGEKKNVTFLFSCLKSLSFRVQEGIVALTLFSGRRVAACQRQLHAGSFALHVLSGFEGELFLPLDRLLL